MKAFAERNPIRVAAVGLVGVVVVVLGAYYFKDLPFVSGTSYTADFGDAANLQTGDDVRVAGVKVGSVTSIALAGQHVSVGFDVDDAWIGDRSTVSIAIKTTLGEEYLAIDPQGAHAQDPDRAIALSRTETPFDITAALSGLASSAGRIDTTQLAKSFDTLSDTFAHTPPAVRSALSGLTRLSRTIAGQDGRITSLSQQTDKLTTTLAASNDKFTKLIDDGAVLLSALRARSAAITQLLQGTRALAQQLSGLVHDDGALLGPALAQLTKVTTILDANQGNLTTAVRLIGPYYTLLNNATGSGPWLDIYICGLFGNQDTPILSATVRRNCQPQKGTP